MHRTALYEAHLNLGGRMVDFAGWELPVQYPTGPTREHEAVRTAAGLFDIDHMGQFELRGPDAEAFLALVQVADISKIGVWGAGYSLLTYADGTIVDDIFLYHLPDHWLIVVNASNRAKDFVWLASHVRRFEVDLSDGSDSTYMLALQGPASELILQRLTDTALDSLAPRRAVAAAITGVPTFIGRTGYTGEDGFELYFPADSALLVWQALLVAGADHGLLPCGLAARDSLRFEASMPLYGHEIDAMTSPIEAVLGWAVDYDHDFIGRDAVLKAKLEGTSRRLVGFEMVDMAMAREGYPITVNGAPIGHVTSGIKSPTLDRFLGMGYVDELYSAIGTNIDVVVRGKPKRAALVRRPFYRRQRN